MHNLTATHTQALRSLENEVKRLGGILNDFVQGTYTTHFTPRSALEAPPPTGASFGPAAPVPLPVENLAKAAEKPGYRMSRTAETIPALVFRGSLPSKALTSFMARTGAQGLMPLLSANSTLGGRP